MVSSVAAGEVKAEVIRGTELSSIMQYDYFPQGEFDEPLALRSAVQGDHHAFSELVKTYDEWVRQHVRRFLLNRRCVQPSQHEGDVTQDTWRDAWENISKFEGRAKFSTWIYRIAYNNCYDHARTCRRTADDLDSHDETGSDTVRIADPEQLLMDRELIEYCRQRVSPSEWAALKLSIEGLPGPEIADELHISEEAVRVRLFRARAKVKKIIQGIL